MEVIVNGTGYVLVNESKVRRAIEGTVTKNGQLEGGVGSNATAEAIIAKYDQLGGLILSGGNKVKLGSFYDFEKKQARKEPKVTFIFRDLRGEEVEIEEGEEVPVEVKAAKLLKEKKPRKAKK
jgi:hypothetical protein